jgi:hypothetical protein
MIGLTEQSWNNTRLRRVLVPNLEAPTRWAVPTRDLAGNCEVPPPWNDFEETNLMGESLNLINFFYFFLRKG